MYKNGTEKNHQDARFYQELLESSERAAETKSLRASIKDMRAGNVVPAEEVLTEMRHILAEKQAR